MEANGSSKKIDDVGETERDAATRNQFAAEKHAVIYKKHRPKADPKAIERILNFAKEKKSTRFTLAVDIACGSGQGTEDLAQHFEKVIGIDISSAQINEANRTNKATNVEYKVGDAENIPVKDNSVDLVTCSQAVHWFDFDTFLREVDRILTPNGVLAVYSRGDYVLLHDDQHVEKELTTIYKECTWKTLKNYWNDPVHATRQKGYVDLNIPYPDFNRTRIQSKMDMTLTELTGFISSFTAYQRFRKENPDEDIFTPLYARFLRALKVNTEPDKTVVTAGCPLYLLMGRKPDEEEIKRFHFVWEEN
ncbi:putative methyltransferase DDB_G0268948 [Amphiura filiformis]|uniref:putative methyltransferase DDB_G0268948 n=1 Tax=Amphiura filiformis TaxID=82378 RepID=UPI003B21188E